MEEDKTEQISDGKVSAMSTDSSSSDLVVVTAIIESVDEYDQTSQSSKDQSTPSSPSIFPLLEDKQVYDKSGSVIESSLDIQPEKDIVCVTSNVCEEIISPVTADVVLESNNSNDKEQTEKEGNYDPNNFEEGIEVIIQAEEEIVNDEEEVVENEVGKEMKLKDKVENEVGKEMKLKDKVENEVGKSMKLTDKVENEVVKEIKVQDQVENEAGKGTKLLDKVGNEVGKGIKLTDKLENVVSEGNKIIEKTENEISKVENDINKTENERKIAEQEIDKRENKDDKKENGIEEEVNKIDIAKIEIVNEENKALNIDDKELGDKEIPKINNVIEILETTQNTVKEITNDTQDCTANETESNLDSASKGISRELKSLIKSAKESKIINECTQVKTKMRKSTVNLGSNTSLNISIESDKSLQTRRGSTNSQISNSSEKSHKSIKRSMRSQNPDFVTKQKQFLNLVTGKLGKDWDSTSEADSVDDNNVSAVESPVTVYNAESRLKTSTPAPKSRKHSKPLKNRIGTDPYCWHCHWAVDPGNNEKVPGHCTVCPRSYHFKCLNAAEKTRFTSSDKWVCPECMMLLAVENSANRSPAMRKVSLGTLNQLLTYAWNRILETHGIEPFMSSVDRAEFPDYDNYIVNPMSLNKIKKNIENCCYGSTEAFHTDILWILHNSIIFNSVHSKLTVLARSLVRTSRSEMAEIENCPECYAAAHTKKLTWFIDVCSNPHILLWAKLKGFPYWPAKGMSMNNAGQVDVRFFGAHDRARVPAKDCYLYSINDPNNFRVKRQDILDSMKEAEDHIRNIARKFGMFVHADFQTKFEPSLWNEQLQKMIPNLKIDPSFNRIFDKNISAKVKKSPSNDCKDDASDDECRPILKRKMADGKEIRHTDSFEKSIAKENRVRPASVMERNHKMDEPETPPKRRRVSIAQDPLPSPTRPKRRKRAKSLHDDEPDKDKKPVKLNKTVEPKETDIRIIIKSRRRAVPTEKAESLKAKIKNSNAIIKSKPINNDTPKEKPAKEIVNEETTTKNDNNKSIPKIIINKDGVKTVTPKTRSRESTPTTRAKKNDINNTANKTQITIQKDSKTTPNEKPKRVITSTPKSSQEKAKESSKEKDEVKNKSESVKSRQDSNKTENIKEKAFSDKSKIEIKDKNEATEPKVKPIKLIRNSNNRKSLTILRDDETEQSNSDSNKKAKNTTKENANKSLPVTSNNSPIVLTNAKATKAHETHTVIPIPGFPTITNIRSLSSSDIQTSALLSPIAVAKEKANLQNSVPEKRKPIPTKITSEKSKNTKETNTNADKNSQNALIGRVGVRSFARIPPVEKSINTVEVEIKGEPIDEDSRHSEKMELMKNVNLCPVAPMNKLREIRVNKVQKAKMPDLPARARKSFPSSKKSDESLCNNGMVYIPIQPPDSVGPKSKTRIVTTNMAPVNIPRLPTPVSIAPSPIQKSTPQTPVVSVSPSISVAGSAGAAISPTVASTSVRTMPMLTAVNGQWTLALQPVMSVGSNDNPVVNGVTTATPDVMMVNDNAETSILPDRSSVPNPLDPTAPMQQNIPTPSSAGLLTSKLNQNAAKMTDYFRTLLLDCMEKIDVPAAVLTHHKLQLEELRWKHQQELQELRHNHSLMLAEVRTSVNTRLTTEMRRSFQTEVDAVVANIKTKQWCANCRQEAKLLCCWNTSYCDENCQRAHYTQHRPLCRPIVTDYEHRVKPLVDNVTAVPSNQSAVLTSNTIGTNPPNPIIVNVMDDRVRCVGPYMPGKQQNSIVINSPVQRMEDGRSVVSSGGYLILGGGTTNTIISRN